jgi:hypothetical protein
MKIDLKRKLVGVLVEDEEGRSKGKADLFADENDLIELWIDINLSPSDLEEITVEIKRAECL